MAQSTIHASGILTIDVMMSNSEKDSDSTKKEKSIGTFTLETDLDEATRDVLLAQMYSRLHELQLDVNVNIEEIEVIRWKASMPNGMVIEENKNDHGDDRSLRQLGFQTNAHIVIQLARKLPMQKKDGVRQHQVQTHITFAEFQESCTRVFADSSAIRQPKFVTTDNRKLCSACAEICHLREQISAINLNYCKQSFVCECNSEGHECLFVARYGTVPASNVESVGVTLADRQQWSVQSESSQKMLQRLKSHMLSIRSYERDDWQTKARNMIPIVLLEERACKALDSKPATERRPYRDQLVAELLHWFKNEFFSWINTVKCEKCHSDTDAFSNSTPTLEERQDGASNVELHKCKSCQHLNRFPRYNNAAKLLDTRRGRCGEWSQAFLLCCRALGFRAREVVDWTDHVWTEVFSDNQKRWLHADACEASLDNPLLYEAGWGKKLVYCIAFGAEDVVDVTQRYTRKYEEVLSRRDLCPEAWLSDQIRLANDAIRAHLPEAERAKIIERADNEQKELASYGKDLKATKPEELQVRQTGSLEWRAARGELGPAIAANAVQCVVPGQGVSEIHVEESAVPASNAHKQKVKKLFEMYVKQLTVGCATSSCSSEFCKTNTSYAAPVNANDAAKAALWLVAKHGTTMICPHLSKPV